MVRIGPGIQIPSPALSIIINLLVKSDLIKIINIKGRIPVDAKSRQEH